MGKRTHIITLLIIMVLGKTLHSQTVKDTVYFDANGYMVDKAIAHHYLLIPMEKEKELYRMTKKYLNGKTYKDGLTPNPYHNFEIYEGLVTTYHPNGTIKSTAEYKNYKYHGRLEWFNESGQNIASGIAESGNFTDGTFFIENDFKHYLLTVKNNQIITKIFSYANGKKAQIDYFNKSNVCETTEYFNLQGDSLGSLAYHTNPNAVRESGTKVDFHFQHKMVAFIKAISTYNTVGNLTEILTKTPKGKTLAKGTYNRTTAQYSGSIYEQGNITVYKENTPTKVTFYKPNGEALAVGVFKDAYPYNGTFCSEIFQFSGKSTPPKHQIVCKTYKNGVLEGKQITYNPNFKVEAYTTYKAGNIEGEAMSTSIYTGKQHKIIYKNGKPFEGDEINLSINSYKEGLLVEKKEFDFDTNQLSKISYYNTNKELIKVKQKYKQNWYEAIYKSGKLFEGYEATSKNVTAYKNGEKNGKFIQESYHLITQGNYENGMLNGVVTYFRKQRKDTLSCLFKKDNPVEGLKVEHFNPNFITTYKNKVKHGKEVTHLKSYFSKCDAVERYFEKGYPTGISTYFKDEKPIATLTYKNHIPYDGVLLGKRFKKEFKNGQLVLESKIISSSFVETTYYKMNTIVKREYTLPRFDEPAYTIIYKNGKPFQGTLVYFDSEAKTTRFSQYKNFKKEGKEQLKLKVHKDTISIEQFYVSEKQEGASHFIFGEENENHRGIYKNGNPQNGQFLELLDAELIAIAQYKNNECLKKVFYFPHKPNKVVDSIIYKNNMPFEGVNYAFFNKMKLKQYVTKGIKTKTEARYVYDFSENAIEIHHKPLVDSIYSSRCFYPNAEVAFTDSSLKSGRVDFSKDDKSLGFLVFKDRVLKDIQLEYVCNKQTISVTMHSNTSVSITGNELNTANLTYKTIVSSAFFIPEDMHNLYVNFPFINPSKSEIISYEYYLNDLPNPIAEITMQNGKYHSGDFISYDSFNKTYVYRVYFNGENIIVIKNLSLEDLEAMYQEKQH